jgi:N-acetylglucosamine-6-phosphate deacetylase
MAELICDGIHVHESMVRAAFKLFPGRIILISDSMRAAGLENGSYDLGGQSVTVNGSLATLSDGTIAGSVTNLFEGMKKAVSFGIPLEDAVTAATENPARSIGIYDLVGSLTPGKRADVILLDKDLNLVRVIS